MSLFDPRQLWLFGPKLRGPVFFSVGAFLLATQLLAWWLGRLLSSWLLGGGFAFVLIGGIAWFFYLDDLHHGKDHSSGIDSTDELPSADQYDAMLADADADADGDDVDNDAFA